MGTAVGIGILIIVAVALLAYLFETDLITNCITAYEQLAEKIDEHKKWKRSRQEEERKFEGKVIAVDFDGVSCIIVDEAQFLTEVQVKELMIITKMLNIPVICYGLKTNFKGELFKGSQALLALSDDLEELATICSCGKKAKFNVRLGLD